MAHLVFAQHRNTCDIIVLALYCEGGGGSGIPPPEKFWFERSKIV